ncbi:hypothetical protein [Coralloluteibacterium thermophilus]|uniref:DUF1364 family protein n=1 Tax=Coralloluteibacterium thermophilum TaxID=2707049 RepID=A0ABV9NQU5_9GAMM
MNYRNRSLLDLAYKVPCAFNLPGICEGGMGEPAHSNQSRHGKGGALKAHDCFFASACRSCHREIDQGRTMSRDEKFEAWNRAYERTVLELWRRGLVEVSGRCEAGYLLGDAA